MAIVLNEKAWVEDVLHEKELGKQPYITLQRVARYYMTLNHSKETTRDMLDAFVLMCEPHSSLVTWSPVLDKVVKNADKQPMIMIDYIDLSATELQKISEIKSKPTQRLAFTLLCVAKYHDLVNPSANHWVSDPDSELMAMANIKASIKKQSAMFKQLRDMGYIEFSSKVDNLSVRVLFTDTNEAVLHIDDFRNLGYQYMRYCGSPEVFECANCGIVTKYNNTYKSRNQKYCASCATIVAMKQKVESIMRKKGVKN